MLGGDDQWSRNVENLSRGAELEVDRKDRGGTVGVQVVHGRQQVAIDFSRRIPQPEGLRYAVEIASEAYAWSRQEHPSRMVL
jgi:hypothetical protein